MLSHLHEMVGTVKAWCFPILFVQSSKLNTYVWWRYSLKSWPVCFTYKVIIYNFYSVFDPVKYFYNPWLNGFSTETISLKSFYMDNNLQLVDY